MSDKKIKQLDEIIELIKKWRLIQRPGENHDLFKQLDGEWDVKLIFHGEGQSWESNQIEFFGLSDEPMLEINDTTMKYTLEIVDYNCHKWNVFELALGENSMAFKYLFKKLNE